MQVGRYGGLEEEVEHLKRDKNLLMLELVRLRQQQQVIKADWHVSFLVNARTVHLPIAVVMAVVMPNLFCSFLDSLCYLSHAATHWRWFMYVVSQGMLCILQNTDQETKRLLARLESTEQRQQQMMAFLAKAVQNPAFLQELLTNQRHAQRISGPEKSACCFVNQIFSFTISVLAIIRSSSHASCPC